MIDFTIWDQLLRQYVDNFGRVNYSAWQRENHQTLTNWLKDLETLNYSPSSNPNDQLALWINLYNAFTVSAILNHYPIKSILPKIWGISNWLAFLWFFNRPAYKFAGKRYSLGKIEHGILRKKLQDPRIHFAIVCASIGCPLLRNSAYFPETVQQQLAEDASRFINNSDKVRYDFQTKTLFCSKIFKWYRQDFLAVSPSIPDYIRTYLKTDLPFDAKTPIAYLHYDWSLNEQ
ncbi:DUF547 domain-containing protein [Floridanema aerugineum]|jgi:hypothetical protein|uniref:DUF547 domain-containing protein n=1 Tax=Floridaenema aerugineum BLCC-F46 TaxID=3153654 RepID=A0ABV4XCI9_9CYAN